MVFLIDIIPPRKIKKTPKMKEIPSIKKFGVYDISKN